MPYKPDMPCAVCGTLMWRGTTSAAKPICRPCRAVLKSEKQTTPAIQRHTCLACDAQWERQSTKGQTPLWCPDCAGRYSLRECAACGERKPITKRSKRCRDCWDLVKPVPKSKALEIYTGPRHQPRKTDHVYTAHRLTSGVCRVCGSWFVSHFLDVTCGSECFDVRKRETRRVSRDRRRARKRDAFIENVYRKRVFDADGYRCHICSKKTDKTKQVPHPKAPTVDHVVPLSKGGTHEPANCRTACFMCNSLKSDGGGGEQMLLLAV